MALHSRLCEGRARFPGNYTPIEDSGCATPFPTIPKLKLDKALAEAL